jgi:ATP-dependent Clp protease ATP-binding subunit ClpC
VFEKFTNLAKRSLTYAQDEAVTLRHDFIGTEHLLLGLVRVREGVGVQVITALGVDPATLRPVIISRLGSRAS